MLAPQRHGQGSGRVARLEIVRKLHRCCGAEESRSPTKPTRLFLVGFGLPDNSEGARLHAGYVFTRDGPGASGPGGEPDFDGAGLGKGGVTFDAIQPIFGKRSAGARAAGPRRKR